MSLSSQIQKSYLYCEKIAQKNLPYLYLVSNFFEDKNKYKAFCVTYASMRILDDEIDSIESRDKLTFTQRKRYHSLIDDWLTRIHSCFNGENPGGPIFSALKDVLHRFNLPVFPWQKLAKAMKQDVEKEYFANLDDFLDYAEGAAISPATVFMYLLMSKRENGIYQTNPDKSYRYAKNLAIFCYLTHILRDISKDLELGKTGLLYLPQADLERFKIAKKDLQKFKKNGKASPNFKKLVLAYAQKALNYERKGRKQLTSLWSRLSQDSWFILKLLLEFYSQTLRKIIQNGGNVFDSRIFLTPQENLEIIETVARQGNYSKLHFRTDYLLKLFSNKIDSALY